MPRPVFPVVRLPYDRPDRVARVLDAVRREFRAAAGCGRRRPTAMTARVLNAAARGEPEKNHPLMQPTAVQTTAASAAVDQAAVDHVTVGVRDCTLTPKARPEITVTAGGAAARNASYLDDLQNRRRPAPADDVGCGGPYLLVPPVNVTAEISRPPLTPRYTATS